MPGWKSYTFKGIRVPVRPGTGNGGLAAHGELSDDGGAKATIVLESWLLAPSTGEMGKVKVSKWRPRLELGNLMEGRRSRYKPKVQAGR
jgi:hypothetical protein